MMPRILILLLAFFAALQPGWAQRFQRPPAASLAEEYTKAGSLLLRAFEPVSLVARESTVQLESGGKGVALGVVIDPSGLVLTKASETVAAKSDLSAQLATGQRVRAEVKAIDEENDVALVKLEVTGLKPIEWSSQPVAVGQWVVTPGIDSTPEAVGIVSTPPRRVFPRQALIGVQLDFTASEARIAGILEGFGAEKAGLRAGDVILAVNTTSITNSQQLVTYLRSFRAGQTVDLRVRRDSEEIRAHIEMMAPPPDNRRSRFNRRDRMDRLGSQLSSRAEGFDLAIQHDTVLQAWQCGGPLLDLDGKAVGLNIARAGRVASYALPADLVRLTLEKLKSEITLPVSQEPAPDAVPRF